MTKTCTSCLRLLDKSNFHKNKATIDGLCYQCKDCNYRKSKKWKEENVEKRKTHQYKRKYGLTFADYGVILASQNSQCAICSVHFSEAQRGVLFVDHCHTTGKVRGLLCQNCNTAIGLLRDSPLLCTKAAEYLLSSLETESK